MSTYAVIMAGGSGTRFWPASRERMPKQLLPLADNPEESLLAATVRRLAPIVPDDRVYIATGERLRTATTAALPHVPASQILAEPVARNTAPCIAWAAATIARRDPDALVAVLPSDHYVADEEGFRRIVTRALDGAREGYLTTIGIVPTRPETGYGYIEVGDEALPGIRLASRFVEKPSRAVAEEYLAGQKHLWNAGMFFFHVKTMLDAIAKHLPELADGIARIDEAARRGDEAAAVASVFPTLPSVSIDHGVMEKASRIAVVPGDFGWNDVGSWQSAWELARRDSAGNALPDGAIAIEARNNLVRDLTSDGSRKLVALLGVDDLVVVQTDDAILVIPRDRAQDVRAIVERLKAGRSDLL
jgi:mannose-1-phosphate guanylyltransferase